MVQRRELKIKVEETDCAVSGFGGAAALIRVAQQSGLMEEMEESLKGMKKRRRGHSVSEMAMDVMLLMCFISHTGAGLKPSHCASRQVRRYHHSLFRFLNLMPLNARKMGATGL